MRELGKVGTVEEREEMDSYSYQKQKLRKVKMVMISQKTRMNL